MTKPFSYWYAFPEYVGGSEHSADTTEMGDDDDAITQKVLLGSFEGYLRQLHTRQQSQWEAATKACFRVGRPANTVTFAPSRFSPCYGLRAATTDVTSEAVTARVLDGIRTASIGKGNTSNGNLSTTKGVAANVPQPTTPIDPILGAIVRVPSIHPLHPLVNTLLQNQDESTMIAGDPSAEHHVVHVGDDNTYATATVNPTSSTTGNSGREGNTGAAAVGGAASVAAIISNLPPHPLRALVHGVEDFMVQNDQRHRRLTQLVDFLCKRFDGDLSLMLSSTPARHRTRLNAAIFDCVDKDDERCGALLDSPELWDTELKAIIMKEYAVSVAMRNATLQSVALMMSATGAGMLNEQINRHVAMAEEMLRGSYLVLGAVGKLTVSMLNKAGNSSENGVVCDPTPSPLSSSLISPLPGDADGDNSLSIPVSIADPNVQPTKFSSPSYPVSDAIVLEHLARILMGKVSLCLSDSSIEFGSLFRIPPPTDEVQTSSFNTVITTQSHASNPLVESRLRKLLASAFPPLSIAGGADSLKKKFADAIENVVFKHLFPILISAAPTTKDVTSDGSPAKKRTGKHFLRSHHLLCLEALLVLIDTVANIECGCEAQTLDAFYNEFVQRASIAQASVASCSPTSTTSPAQSFPLWFYPNEVVQWLTATPNPYSKLHHEVTIGASRPTQQTTFSAAGLVSLGIQIETLAVRCYSSELCEGILDYWDGISDDDISEDQVNATGALREFNFKVELSEHPLKSSIPLCDNPKRAPTVGSKRARESDSEDDDSEMRIVDAVTGAVDEERYRSALLLTMPDTVTISQIYEGY